MTYLYHASSDTSSEAHAQRRMENQAREQSGRGRREDRGIVRDFAKCWRTILFWYSSRKLLQKSPSYLTAIVKSLGRKSAQYLSRKLVCESPFNGGLGGGSP
jgi:hypothetical protein